MQMTLSFSERESWAATECRIIVVYEDDPTRERAMTLVGHLKRRFDEEIEFACTWWKFRYLASEDISMVARHYAASADIVIFSSDGPGLFPRAIMQWIETWTERRSKDGGALVPLIGSPYIPQSLYTTKRLYLQNIAHRAGLDYLPQSVFLPGVPGDSNDDLHSLPSVPLMEQRHIDSSRTSIRSE